MYDVKNGNTNIKKDKPLWLHRLLYICLYIFGEIYQTTFIFKNTEWKRTL